MNQISSYLLLGFEGTTKDLFITFGLDGAATPSSVTPPGVHVIPAKRRKINLAEETDRSRAAEFIKAQLALDRQRAEAQAIADAQSAKKASRKGRKSAPDARLAELEAQRQLAIQEQANNDILALIMMSVQ
jgi:hypothetical protein